jgi:osmoprotectant transport system substrate-binding protein
VIASFNFPESHLLAEIYGQALEGAGFEVRHEAGLGPRELVLPAIRQGFVDVVPEYIGAALQAVRPEAAVAPGDPRAVRSALREALAPWSLDVLEPAPAANQNGFVLTAAMAGRDGLRTISDLLELAPSLTLGGFLPFSGELRTARALEEGVIDVAVLFTTDGVLAEESLVLLEDDRGLQPAENVAPLVRADGPAGSPAVASRLDEVSARLTTADLRFLNWRITVAGGDPAAEARGWLIRRGLIPR